jgi:hypothetical protein
MQQIRETASRHAVPAETALSRPTPVPELTQSSRPFQSKRLTGTYAVDDDGVPTRVNTVVESGILKLVLKLCCTPR